MLHVSHLRKLSHIHRVSQNFHLIWTSKVLNSPLPLKSLLKLKQDYAVVPQTQTGNRRDREKKLQPFQHTNRYNIPLFNNTLEYVIPLCSLSIRAYSFTGKFSSIRINKFITDQSSWNWPSFVKFYYILLKKNYWSSLEFLHLSFHYRFDV